MFRPYRLLLAASFAGAALTVSGPASATPFSDVPANHWAYQYIQSLAADGLIDGYPDGLFKGDRPLTRYEMAVVIARVIAKLQENVKPAPPYTGPSKADLEKLQKLIDALKDELDSLGVRVTNVEDSLSSLDKRTKFAQSLEMHGTLLPNESYRQRVVIPRTIVNTTGAPVTLYFGGTVAAGRTAAVDPFVSAYLPTNETNNPLTADGTGLRIRQDDQFSLVYHISDNLKISLPVKLINFEFGGEFTQQAAIDITPQVEVDIPQAGNLGRLHLKFGIIDDLAPSRTGLAYRPPDGGSGTGPYIPYENPEQPFQRGVLASATLNGRTDVRVAFTRIDDTLLDTNLSLLDPAGTFGTASYLFPVVPPQAGLTQTTPAGAPTSATFNSGTGVLSQVFLPKKAVNGSVYVSFYNGTTYNNAGLITGGPAIPAPAFTYDEALNAVVFNPPLPAGSTVTLSFNGLTNTNNTQLQRYQINARINHRLPGNAEIGFTFNRIFDFDDLQTTGDLTAIQQAAATGIGLVSDTVFGVDFQLPIPIAALGPGGQLIPFGEAASSKFTADYRNVAAVGDTAGVIGLKLKISKIDASVQYSTVGPNFLDGAPFRYFGNAPALFAFYHLPYQEDFYGLASNLGINQQFDAAFTALGRSSTTAGNPNLTYSYPVYNPFKGYGPFFFQSFTPNTRAIAATASMPLRVGDVTLATRGSYTHDQELRPNSSAGLQYGQPYTSAVPLQFDEYRVGASTNVPAFGQRATLSASGGYERLYRNDRTPFPYVPFNPATQTFDAAAAAAVSSAFGPGKSPVSFYPNYLNQRRFTWAVSGVAPLTKGVNLSLSYNTQQFGGENGTTLTQNISERKDTSFATLAYAIPGTNSSVSVSARQYHYTDDVLPTSNLTQNRQDVLFTVRF